MNISDELLIEEFADFSVTITSDSTDVLNKLRDICASQCFDASDVVAQWLAYSLTTKHCKISAANLDAMERHMQLKKTAEQKKQGLAGNKKIYNISNVEQKVNANTTDDLLGSYSTPNGKVQKRQHTPDNAPLKRKLGRNIAPFSPTSISPARSTPSQKYNSRIRPGEAVCSYGNTTNAQWRSQRINQASIKPFDETTALTKKFNYMFQKITDKAFALNGHIDELTQSLQKHHDIEEFTTMCLPSQAPVTIVGRIGCDSNGKLNAQSVILEELHNKTSGKNMYLDLSGVKQYSLFPGQVVAVEGTNPTGNGFAASKVYENVGLPLPAPPSISSGLRVLMACGPFTTVDNLGYEPFTDLLAVIQRDAPDVCILMGPFVDVKNPLIEKCEIEDTFEGFFTKFMRNLQESLKGLDHTKIVILPSHRDVHHHTVYPQPPFTMSNMEKEKFYFASDPCTLNIDGVVFGITSTDILFQLGTEEISYPPGSSDRLARLTKHIISQQTFYPLYPSSDELNVDYDHWDIYGRMTITPHVLIVPSDLRYFIKDVSGTCCINPGRLSKGQVGGTYCRMIINPSSTSSVVENTIAEVIRI